MENIKLLIVEDDEGLSFIEKTGLEDIVGGYDVSIASYGKDGLEMWESTHPDVIVADVDMPVMNGLEMVEHIRRYDNRVIIIFTSALTSPKDVQAGYRIGVNNYVKKPFEPEELDAHINHQIDNGLFHDFIVLSARKRCLSIPNPQQLFPLRQTAHVHRGNW